MKRKTEIVSFRADASLLARIDAACSSIGLSRGDWVREIILAHLHNLDESIEWPAQLADSRQLLEQIEHAIERLSNSQKRLLYIVLTVVGEIDSQQAKEIVKCKFSS